VVVVALDKVGTAGQVSNVAVVACRTTCSRRARRRTSSLAARATWHRRSGRGQGRGRPLQGRGNRLALRSEENRRSRRGRVRSRRFVVRVEVWCDVDTLRTLVRAKPGLVDDCALNSASAFDAFKATIESDKTLASSVARNRVLRQAIQRRRSHLGHRIVISVFFSFGAMIAPRSPSRGP